MQLLTATMHCTYLTVTLPGTVSEQLQWRPQFSVLRVTSRTILQGQRPHNAKRFMAQRPCWSCPAAHAGLKTEPACIWLFSMNVANEGHLGTKRYRRWTCPKIIIQHEQKQRSIMLNTSTEIPERSNYTKMWVRCRAVRGCVTAAALMRWFCQLMVRLQVCWQIFGRLASR